jgi:hypothetical protein
MEQIVADGGGGVQGAGQHGWPFVAGQVRDQVGQRLGAGVVALPTPRQIRARSCSRR